MKQGREGDHQQSRATQSRNGQSRESMLSESQEKVLPGKGCALGQSGRDQTEVKALRFLKNTLIHVPGGNTELKQSCAGCRWLFDLGVRGCPGAQRFLVSTPLSTIKTSFASGRSQMLRHCLLRLTHCPVATSHLQSRDHLLL